MVGVRLSELRRSVWNLRMAAMILIGFSVLMNPILSDLTHLYYNEALYWVSNAMGLSNFTSFACLFPAIPYALTFVEEYNSGYLKVCLPRYGKKRYIADRILATAFSGGMVTLMAFGLVFLVCVLGGQPTNPAKTMDEFYQGSVWEPFLYIWGGKLVLLMKLGLAFLHGAIWALAALLVSTITANRYAAVVLPFVVYQLLWVVMQRSLWNPVFLLRADSHAYRVWYQPYGMQILTLTVLLMVNVLCMDRRCRKI